MTPPARATRHPAYPGYPGSLSLAFLVLTCFALPQQAAAQSSTVFIGSTFTIADTAVTEGGIARFEVTVELALSIPLALGTAYAAGTADFRD